MATLLVASTVGRSTRLATTSGWPIRVRRARWPPAPLAAPMRHREGVGYCVRPARQSARGSARRPAFEDKGGRDVKASPTATSICTASSSRSASSGPGRPSTRLGRDQHRVRRRQWRGPHRARLASQGHHLRQQRHPARPTEQVTALLSYSTKGRVHRHSQTTPTSGSS